ncbi:MAG: hypothetical protein KME49_03655 [Brasilonema octagenarum HA4186-MV1]|jgi:hypothetical protein|nr:hypothetical protein [Brasilonema octagenarum HA4186-MV1]
MNLPYILVNICSWMNQVEQWFSILQRKRFKRGDLADKKALSERLEAFIALVEYYSTPFWLE